MATLARLVRTAPCLRQLRFRRLSTTTAPDTGAVIHKPVGISFDIDGVLLRGYNQLPHARASLQRLADAHVPFVLLTNGGGETEDVKAKKLTEVLQFPIHPQQVVLSHTPLRPVVQQYANEKILVLGCRDVMSVARSYGARRAYDIPTLAHDDPYRYPFQHFERRPIPSPEREEPFAAVFILHDPNNWGAEIQITMDVIQGGFPLGSGGREQRIPVYASNPDMIFAGVYPVPRLACGSFTHCLKSLWKQLHGTELNVQQCGKPTKMTFEYAAAQMQFWSSYSDAVGFYSNSGAGAGAGAAADLDLSTHRPRSRIVFDHLFHIGDNPAADMRGALNAGQPWKGILVRTGVFQGRPGENDALHPGHAVVEGVKDAIDHALQHL